MGFKCGIVGLPNVGKSTLFNALTAANADASNYPFCTIEPNMGVVTVPDDRLERIVEIIKPEKVIPTVIEFVDIAGLVKGASQGEGLGNQFLAHIREVDAIVHVVRCFEDENVTHISEHFDPQSDIETIQTELLLADLETVSKAMTKAEKASKAGDKEQVQLAQLLHRVHEQMDQGVPVRVQALHEDEQAQIHHLFLLTAKPTLYIANVSEDGFENNPYLATIEKAGEREGAAVVPICAKIEAELTELDNGEKQEFLNEMGLDEPGLNRVIRAGYQLLGLQTFFTTTNQQAQAWTVPIGATAPKAAGVIHTDFERGFIRAEVIHYKDYIQHAGEHVAKEAGKLRLEGKDYVIQDGDVIHFRFNV